MTGWTKLYAALMLAAGLAGCATVAPYEREALARSDMMFDGTPELSASEAHATEVREGSAGGFDAAGGGCGCN